MYDFYTDIKHTGQLQHLWGIYMTLSFTLLYQEHLFNDTYLLGHHI